LDNHFSKVKAELEADLEAEVLPEALPEGLPEALTFCWKQKCRKRKRKCLLWKRKQKRYKFERFRITVYIAAGPRMVT
jgi:hypothetical protein